MHRSMIRLETSKMQFIPKGSTERHAELWESIFGTKTSEGVPKDGGKVRSLINNVRGLDRKLVFELSCD